MWLPMCQIATTTNTSNQSRATIGRTVGVALWVIGVCLWGSCVPFDDTPLDDFLCQIDVDCTNEFGDGWSYGDEGFCFKITNANGTCDAPTPPSLTCIPASLFVRGSPSSSDSAQMFPANEQPQQEIFIDSFFIDKLEVTVAQYKACVDQGNCEPYPEDQQEEGCNWPANRDTHPMNCVTWREASAYCESLDGGRLPTEAQWEKAARGTDGRLYPWGGAQATCEMAVINLSGDQTSQSPPEQGGDRSVWGCGTMSTMEVGGRQAGQSPYGVQDMAGNVGEWVEDWYQADYYARAAPSSPPGPTSGECPPGLEGECKVWRGGSYNYLSTNVRTTVRLGFQPEVRSSWIGFRCAYNPKHPNFAQGTP